MISETTSAVEVRLFCVVTFDDSDRDDVLEIGVGAEEEIVAEAVVRWRKDVSDSGTFSIPGCGDVSVTGELGGDFSFSPSPYKIN